MHASQCASTSCTHTSRQTAAWKQQQFVAWCRTPGDQTRAAALLLAPRTHQPPQHTSPAHYYHHRSKLAAAALAAAPDNGSSSGGVLPPAELTALIKACGTAEQLYHLVLLHAPSFNFIHAAAAFTHAAQLTTRLLEEQDDEVSQQSTAQKQKQPQSQQQQQLPASLLQLLLLLLDTVQQHCGQFQGRQVANCLWAAHKLLHTLQQHQPGSQQQQQPQQQQKQLAAAEQQLELCAAQLLQQADSCWHLFSGQELVLLLYSAAHLPLGAAGSATKNAAVRQCADAAVQQLHVLQRKRRLNSLKLQEVEMLLTAFRRLQQQQHFAVPVRLVQQLLLAAIQQQQAAPRQRALQQQQTLGPRDASGLLYSLAVLGIRPPPATLQQLLPRLAGKSLRQCKAVDLSNTLYALAVLQYRPLDVAWWRGVAAAWQRLLQQQHFSGAELVAAVYALARLRVRLPRQLLEASAAAGAATGASQGLLLPRQHAEAALLLWSLGKLMVQLNPQTLQQLLQVYLQGSASAAAATAGGVGAGPVAAEVKQSDLQQHLERLSQQSGMVVCALGQLGFCPPRHQLQQLLQHSRLLLPHADARCVASLLHGLGRLQLRPQQQWMVELCQQLLGLMHWQQQQQQQQQRQGHKQQRSQQQQQHVLQQGFDSQGLSMALWGLARLKAGQASAAPQQLVVDVVDTSLQLLPAAPSAAGMLLWSLVQLQPLPQLHTDVLQAALQAVNSLARAAQQQSSSSSAGGTQQQQLGQRRPRQGQAVALTFWGLARLGVPQEQQGLVAKSLHGLSHQLQHFNPTDLCMMVWALSHMQLQPPTPWLLRFYAASQALLPQCSDAQLATLAVSLYRLLQLPPGGPQQGAEQEGDSAARLLQQVPPAVWQLQLEWQMRSRWKQRRLQEQQQQQGGSIVQVGLVDDVADEGQQAAPPPADPLRVVTAVLRRWRRWSVGGRVSSFVVVQQEGGGESA